MLEHKGDSTKEKVLPAGSPDKGKGKFLQRLRWEGGMPKHVGAGRYRKLGTQFQRTEQDRTRFINVSLVC